MKYLQRPGTIAWFSFFLVFAAWPSCLAGRVLADNPTADKVKKEYDVSPSRGEWGKTYGLTITDPGCQAGDLAGASVEAPEGSDLTISDTFNDNPCFLTAKVSIKDGAKAIGIVWLRIKDKQKKTQGLAPFEVSSVLPGPTPPGLNPQVDLMWGVIPKNITKDNFGHEIAGNYYCIELVIGNNSGYDLQIVSVGFDSPHLQGGDQKVIVPTAGYPIARGSIERGQDTGLRNYLLRGIKGFGPILTGFTPFFKAAGPRASYSTAVDIFSNPLEKGYELVIPDLTISQLNRLDAQMLRDGLIISNNAQRRTLVFFPKAYLASAFTSGEDRDDTKLVRQKLGQLVLEGVPVEYRARIRVVSSRPEDNRPTVTGVTYKEGSAPRALVDNAAETTVVIEGQNLDNASVVVPEKYADVLSIVGDVQRTAGRLEVKVKIKQGAKPGEYELDLVNPAGSVPVTLKVQ